MPHEVLMLSPRYGVQKEYVDQFLASRDCYVSEQAIPERPSEDQVCELAANAGGIITGLGRVTERVMDAAPKLKVVSTGGVGFDHVDLRAASERGIVVANCAGCNNHSVSELAFGMMLGLARNIRMADQLMRTDGWASGGQARAGQELWGKTLGIVGLGRVGKSTALLGRAFGMRVLANDLAWDITFANQWGISYVPLDTLLQQSDYVTLHTPLTDFTRELIDERAIDLMKPGAFLINTSRGPVVKEAALVNALATKRLAGAALDVFQFEPHPDNPYTEFDNVILTPHIGGSTVEAGDRSLYLAMTNVTNVLNGLPAHSQVN